MSKYVIGIDLGTTNCALAYAPIDASSELPATVQLFGISQLVAPGEVREEDLLPSSLYIPGEGEFVEGSLSLPWDTNPRYLTGRFAQKRGIENTNRLVASAKSWLSSTTADPTEAFLPLTASEGITKISAVDTSHYFLSHLAAAWNAKFPEDRLEEQSIFLTVPASFNAVAREFTQKAAALANYPSVTLLEEPQAAFYAWIDRTPHWREQVTAGDLILVIDIGGGTTDFTLIAVTESQGELQLERIAVGDHILLGGDNMDLALARHVEQQLAAKNTKLDAMQFHALWQQARAAKEVLLSDQTAAPEEHAITILGRGTGLIGGSIRTKLTREEAGQILLDGFFPVVDTAATPAKPRRAGLLELGLPYASDAAITRHLAQFLRQAGANADDKTRRGSSGFACPTHVLFNGGVLQSRAIEERLLSVLNEWILQEEHSHVTVLEGETKSSDLMHSVAYGAAYYGLAKTGKGVRIRGGVARSYYIGVESAMPAVPGMSPPMKVFTVVPFGLEEGSKVELPQQRFALVVGEHAEFRFFSSLNRQHDAPGTLLDQITDEFEELQSIEVFLPAGDGRSPGEEVVPVTLESAVTETGMLELWCVAADGRRWKLEFNVRERVAA